MNLNELDQYLELINSVLLKSAVKLNKWREKFMLEVLLLYLIIPGGLISFNRVVMVALVNNAIGLSCLLPSGSGSNTADKNTGASYIHINRLVSTCAAYTQGNTSATGKLCGCGCLLLQIHLCVWRI